MKKIIAGLIVMVSFSHFCYGQKDTLRNFKINGTLKIAPLDFIANTLTLGFEKSIGNSGSIQVFGSFIMHENPDYYNDGRSIGGAGELQYRKYLLPGNVNLKGLYTGIFGKYTYLESDLSRHYYYDPYGSPYYNNSTFYLHQASGGMLAGYQFIVANILVFDLYLGGGIKFSSSNSYRSGNYYNSLPGNTDAFYKHYNGIFPKAGAKMGITF